MRRHGNSSGCWDRGLGNGGSQVYASPNRRAIPPRWAGSRGEGAGECARVPAMTHDLPVLRELVLLAGCSLAVILLFRRGKPPPGVGFLFTGILFGPGGVWLGPGPAPSSAPGRTRGVPPPFTLRLQGSITD